MASAFPKKTSPKKTSIPRLLSREKLKSVSLLPSKLLREKFHNVKKASTGTSFLPRIGPFPHTSETGQKLSPVPQKKSLFQVSPPEIVFQNFDVNEVSEMQLFFINKDKFPRLVKVSMERSPYFELVCPNDAYHIMPPGMSSPVRIRFTPKKNKNYSHQLVCLTPREQVVVPIRAIAARAILEFPDQLDFSECPVKYSTQKTVLLRNVGNLEAQFQLSTQSPFFVVPASGTLGAGDTMQVTVGFHPLTIGDHSGSLAVCCNTGGRSIHTNLRGEAADVAVELSTNSMKVGKTFITTSNYTTMFIKNRSNITAHFQWKAFRTEEDEAEEKRRQCYLLQPLKEAPLKTSIGEENIEQEMAKVQEDPMLFSDDIFSIEPMEGEIGPNRCAKIKVTFKPLEELEYRSVAYCDISGRESRLPLRLRGEGQGPLVELSNRTLNLGNILLNTPYVYEVKLINQAAIDAPFTYIHTTANVGYCFKFAPEKGTIAPGGIQTIQISFNANILGSFEEQFQFIVAGSPTSAILTIKGFVTRPSVHFDIEEIDFGDISFGFPYTKTCRLTNPSPVALTFKLRMSDDGTQPAVNCFDQIRKPNDPSWRDGIHFDVEPREFTMNPSQGTILPHGHQDIEVTLCSNTVMEFYRRLLVDLEGIGNGVASLTITARCLVPELRVYPRVLLYDECRLNVPYERKFLVVNNTDLPGCYGLIPQKRKEDTPVFYSSRKPCGIVQPHSSAEIPVVIEVQTLGEHRTNVLVGVFGDERNPRRQELRSTGRLADIYPSPKLIEFGMIPVLQPNSQIFTLINGGLVSTEFRIKIARKPQCYVIEPREGVIPALGEVPVTITATLDDTGLFADTIQLFTGNSLLTTFELVAVGTGTTITIDKPFVPELNLGYQFRLLPYIQQFKVTNRGHHFHRLFWSVGCHSPPEEEGQSVSDLDIQQFKVTNRGHHFHRLFWSVGCHSPPEEESQSVSDLGMPKVKDFQGPKRTRPVFALEPLWMELQPGESADMVLQGFSHIRQEVQDYVMCEAVIGTTSRMENIIETTISCKFIDPSIEISARQFSFRVEKKPNDVLALQYKPLSLKNTCSLPLDLMLEVEQPFLVCDVDQQPLPDGQPVTLDVGQTCHLYVAFDPAYELDLNSWKEKKVLKINMVNGHPYVACISLWGEVHFPNLQIQPRSLEFGCILAGTEEVRSLEMTNCSPLPVQYHWSFHPDSQVNRLRYERYPLKFKPQPPEKKRTSLDGSAFLRRRFRIRNVEDPGTALRESWDPAQSLGAEPGERQRVSFTFSGHPDTVASAVALCHVQGGPTYEVELTGEASCVSYSLSHRKINCGFQVAHTYERYPLKFKPQPPEKKRTSLDGSAFLRRRFKIRNGEDPGTALRESWDPAQSLGAEVLPSTSEKYYIPLGLGGFRLSTDVPCTPLEVEKAFSILPQSGVLQPGERQRVSFTFSGHPDTVASAVALCHVQGGPTYEVELTGEASCVSYSLSHRKINCGFQMFNEIHHSTVTLANTGKIKFNWMLNLSIAEQYLPGVFLVNPTAGSIAPGEKEVLKFSYMPGVPGAFSRTFQLKVGDLEPENICLKGEASFPMITVNLPWSIKGNEKYEELIKPLQQYSQRRKSAVQKKTQSPKTGTLRTWNLKPRVPASGIASNAQLQIETVMKLVQDPALELQEKLPSHPPHSRFPDKELCQSLVKVELPEYVLDMGAVRKGYPERRTLAITNPGQIPVSFQVDVSALQDTGFRVNLDQIQDLPHRHTVMIEVCCESTHQPRGDVDVLLPIEVAKGPTYNIRLHATVLELLLDLSRNTLQFSDILVGQCQTETVRLYNWLQVPCKWFIKAVVLQVAKGPTYNIRLHATVLELLLDLSRNTLQFSDILVGQCQTETVRLYNWLQVPCKWFIKAVECVTKMPIPSKGTLDAGRWQDLQIQFTPKEERSYKNELKLSICGSRHHLKLHLSGQGLEARLEITPPEQKMGWLLVDSDEVDATVAVKNPCNFPAEFYSLDFDEQYLEEELHSTPAFPGEARLEITPPEQKMGWLLVDSDEVDATVAVKNPCNFPAEFYSLDFDEQYLEEEFLQMAVGSEYQKNSLMPPGAVGGALPEELEHYEAQKRPKAQGAELKAMAEAMVTELQWKKPIQSSSECVLQMDEDEDDALPEKKSLVDKIILERKHKQRERELKWLAQNLEEEAKALEEEERWKKEEKQKEEVKWKKEKKDVSLGKQPAKPEKKESKILGIKRTKILEKGRYKTSKMWKIIISEKKGTKSPAKKEIKMLEREGPIIPEKWKYKAPKMWKTIIAEKGIPKAPEKEEPKAPEDGEPKAPEKGESEIPEYSAEMEKRFQIYESSQQDVAQVFSYCDRVQATVQLPVIQNRNTSQPSDENTGQKTSKPQEKVEKKHEQKSGGQRSLQSSQLETQSEVAEGAVRDVGMPCLDIQVTNPKAMIREILRDGRLPTKDEMLRYLGLHPEGPPLPPAAVLSIVDCPEERLGSAECVRPFTIAAMEHSLAKTLDVKGSSASRYNSPMENQIFTHRTRVKDQQELGSMSEASSLIARPKRYRWTVPDHSEVELKVHSSTKQPGQFEQTLRFELVESKRQYELPCSGTGLYPSISQNTRLVFPQWRETMESDEIILKEYVESTKQFHFGPLLCGKSREWYKAQNCPGNSESVTILNNSPVDAEVQFSFENDGEAETFVLDPPNMTQKPEEKQELTIREYPTSHGFLEDRLICCVEKNPEPVVFSLCCHGVQVKLEVSPMELSFDKLLLHGTDSRTLVLRNNTQLPMAWQFSGLDDLVEAFSLSQDNGTIDPCSKFEVTLNFKAGQIGNIEKTLRLEVSDTGNILGIAQAGNIKISAEVCDVSLSIDMPEGPDGSLEFGTINVLDNVRKMLTLKNKGICNIGYRFILKGAGPRMQDVASQFTVEPQSGTLIASQPGENVEMLFHPTREMLLKNKPILYCQVMDARSGAGGQTVTTIPVRVSATAVYSKFSIEPAPPIDFGAMVKGTKKTQIVVLENKGMLSFEFHIHQAPEDASPLEIVKFRIQQTPKDSSALEIKSSEQEESSPLAAKLKSSSSQDHLTLGMFTVSPCSGSVAAWDQQDITVDCLAREEGTCEEQLYIDITGRDPKDNPLGVPFTLIAESCLPAIVQDVTLAFEEHPIFSSTNLSCKLWSKKGVGFFVRDENKFIFTKVMVGQEAEAHVSIYNASGLPCDAFISIKPRPGRVQSPINNIFKVFPAKMSIPRSSNGIATVTFTPPDEQSYNCIFKAFLVMPKSSVKIESQTLIFACSPVKIRPQTLTFTISGKGYEPQVTVLCPSARSKRGNAVLRFKRLPVGDSEMLPLVMCNKGVIPVKFMLHLEDEHGVFFLKDRHSTLKKFYTEDVEEAFVGNESKPPKKPFLLLHRGQSTKFDVIFKPSLAQRLEGKIRVLVGDIYSNKTLIELVGEGHKDEFTLEGLEEDTEERNADSSLKKDIIDAVRVNHIQFGDCPVGKPYHRTFTITNRTSVTIMHFEWEADATFSFSPKMGYLLPGCAKDITVTLKSDAPAVFRRHLVKCKVTKVNVARPRRKVPDWNDQMSIVTWKDTTRKNPAASWPEKEKVVETAPEPAHTVEEESLQEAEVYLSASVAYSQFKLNTIVVQLKDTVPNQTSTATFRMHNRGNVALEYTWVEAADSEAAKRLRSTTVMRQFLSSASLSHHRKLPHPFWWQQEHPFETHPSELRQLAEQQQDSEQQQHFRKLPHPFWWQQEHPFETHPSELRQLAEQQQDSEQQQQDSEQQQQLQQQQQQQQQQPEQQQPKQQDHSKELHHSEQLHLSLEPVSSSLEICPDIVQDLPLFFINPYHGIIAPGQKQIFHVLFSPKCAGTFRTTVVFRTSDLKSPQKKAEVVVKGTAQEPQCLDTPKRSALRQMEKSQGPKKRVHWKPTLLEHLR
ncbi:PREDICTED: LOW QUALITY PROTEIN: hydrocephalus-inducing protein-like [Ficedula albicollis]|uniref:LOW QUALITY PROTEIN: hydrocephalus-inducing protein-like n=1 Tax=Ficedula albicollis TaxID=59894 RepID=UPI0007AD9332|nr:PREDICTED: LOW QUALITY PROTEIN: hydrocephalus-inducing protein-like [Ficedula albicollis]